MKILAIETSCDETAVAVLEISSKGQTFKVLANFVYSQINIHKKYGGVVPEIAARKHIETIIPLLIKANINKDDIDIIGVVNGPGLSTSLIVGIETAKTLSCVWGKPLVPVNHVKAHILANLVNGEKGKLQNIKFPALCLIVSGGHTSLVYFENFNKFKTIGQTRDDAVGEAFDKVAKMLGLGYPGGPIISQKAVNADKNTYDLPRPMINKNNFDFSYSGLKTAVRYKLAEISTESGSAFGGKTIDKKVVANMSASFQQAAIDVLIHKTIKAAEEYKVKSVLLGGGVSANKELREQLAKAVDNKLNKVHFYQPDLSNTTDNALMVSVGAYYEYKAKPSKYKNYWQKIKVDPNLEI